MSFLKYSIAILAGFMLLSCVEDEIVFQDKGDNIRFTRSLASVAIDENPIIGVDIVNNSTGEDNSEAYDISFVSSNSNVLAVDNNGVLSPGENSLNQNASISVIATLKNIPIDTTIPVELVIEEDEADTIIVGRVTISENEAIGFEEEELKQIIENGFTPRGVINNRVSQIDLEFLEMMLSASFFNFKNEDLENPELTWISDNTEVVAIDERTGQLTPIKLGTSVIRVSAIVDGDVVQAEPLAITVSDETIIEDQPEPENNVSIIGSGTFQSNSFYTPAGSFQIVVENGETRLNLSSDFTSGGRVPDLVVYLSNQTNTNTGAQFISEDIDATGAQSFVIPANVDVSRYSNVLIYCRRFSQRVGFGIINR